MPRSMAALVHDAADLVIGIELHIGRQRVVVRIGQHVVGEVGRVVPDVELGDQLRPADGEASAGRKITYWLFPPATSVRLVFYSCAGRLAQF